MPSKAEYDAFTANPERFRSARYVFMNGFVPTLSERSLTALKAACDANDPRLNQGSTTTPPPLMCVQDWPCEAACAIGFCGWRGDDKDTVGEVEEFFAAKCFQADQLLGEPAACRHFLNWFDETPRSECLATLSKWVDTALATRKAGFEPPLVRPEHDPFA